MPPKLLFFFKKQKEKRKRKKKKKKNTHNHVNKVTEANHIYMITVTVDDLISPKAMQLSTPDNIFG